MVVLASESFGVPSWLQKVDEDDCEYVWGDDDDDFSESSSDYEEEEDDNFDFDYYSQLSSGKPTPSREADHQQKRGLYSGKVMVFHPEILFPQKVYGNFEFWAKAVQTDKSV